MTQVGICFVVIFLIDNYSSNSQPASKVLVHQLYTFKQKNGA